MKEISSLCCGHRFEVGAALFQGVSRASRSRGRQSFFIPGATPHYAPDLPLKLEHIRIEAQVDPEEKTLTATTTQRIVVIAPGLTFLQFDQVGLAVDQVLVSGKAAPFDVVADRIQIRLAETQESAPSPGESFEVAVSYRVKNPARGLYFTGPDADHPDKPYQVWSQGQDEDNRYWFPTFDYPNQKATSEVIVTVPKGYTAVSNGALVSKKENEQGTCFHYKIGTPHVTYLIALAVGQFAEIKESGPRGLPVQYFVAPGLEENGRRAFGNTPLMIEAYERRVGVPYAYEKYSQVAVQDFIFGGMENTSATTQTDLVLHDARAHLDFSGDPLVSHELAHQWFGDLLTCRDWSHAWLNEGFATFMERVWIEENPGKDGGLDEAKYYQFADLRDYLHEDAERYRRPIVCHHYAEPIDLFDCHLYQKGGLVLNLLRSQLGEDLFWQAIRLYVNRHRGGSVETLDLIRAIEDATGRNMRRFFDEWVFGAGHPELELSFEWHEGRKLAEISIEQKQTGGEPCLVKDGATTPLFHLKSRLELTFSPSSASDGGSSSRIVELGGAAKTQIWIPCPSRPLAVRFDPDNTIPKTLKFPRPKEMLLHQLKWDADCMGRIEALLELAREPSKFATEEVVCALRDAVLADRFWGVQAEAAEALAALRTQGAMEALIDALTLAHPKARRAVVKALGKFKDKKAGKALKKLAESDPSYFVEGEATQAWANALLSPGSPPSEVEEVESFLLNQLNKESYREQIRAGALRALASLPGVGRGGLPRSIAALIRWSGRTQAMDARTAAILSLGDVARLSSPAVRAEILEVFKSLALEVNFRTRTALIQALDRSELPDGMDLLESIRVSDPDGRVRRAAAVSISRLLTAGSTPESVQELKGSLEKLEEEHRKLRAMVEELRAQK